MAPSIDLEKEVRGIRAAAVKALALCAACFAAGYVLLPNYFAFPATTIDALIFTVRVDLFMLLWVVAAVGLVSHARRQSADDIGAAASGVPSQSVRMKVAFLQNTLEQAFMAIGSHLVFSTLFSGPALSLVIVAVVLFAIGRVTFYRAYPRGAAARAFGMVTTVIPTMVIVALSLMKLAKTGFAP